jgi:hypothetical protein
MANATITQFQELVDDGRGRGQQEHVHDRIRTKSDLEVCIALKIQKWTP